METIKTKILQTNILKILFVIASILFAIPSIGYLLEHQTVFQFEPYFKFLLNDSNRFDQTIFYILALAILTILYVLLVKNRKVLFQNTKKMFLFLAIVAVIFVIVLPFMSSDIFYYLGVGRLGGTYEQNPYYTTIQDYVEQGDHEQFLKQDTVLAQGYQNDWSGTTVVYGPIWTMICQMIGVLSFGNIDIGLLLFKLLNVVIHLLNAYLIYKLSGKKLFTLLYALNPFVLIEGIASVHNDLFVVLFVLASLYFLIKQKNLVISVIFLALATAVKYFTILLLPFIILYYFRKEKTLKRLGRCIQYGLLFLAVLAIPYLFYLQDMQVLNGLIVQQERNAKSIYVMLGEYFKYPEGFAEQIRTVLLGSFVIVYFFNAVILLQKKTIRFREEMQKANYFILFFLFFLLTNFQPWYFLWLFPLLIWQKAQNIRWMVQISLISAFANSIFLLNGEGWQNGVPYVFALYVTTVAMRMMNEKRREKRKIEAFKKG